ncbi:MAG: NAD(P)-dependent glycerol-3-phosphate dehydrogenase [Paracoccaceae bacterium]|nr:NAD(P)-dependent glycerol-3-phosphate dehydrogenase [Paracoccaceae bacterium]MDG2259799.1 NAD(P)-dependent glycerol-3-phosphate dehydrogenase [Paracoccaceae bacterium]
MSIGVVGSGAFGTALAISLVSTGQRVTLWARQPVHVAQMKTTRENSKRLPGVLLPKALEFTANMRDLAETETVLLAIPTQQLSDFMASHSTLLNGKNLVACCKGIDLTRRVGPSVILRESCPDSPIAILTGPSFAVDIARGMPTALTLACADEGVGIALQQSLTTPNLRLYRTIDVAGAELGGALKNVIAIACGAVMGAQLGESARAALMTRGYAEIVRMAVKLGAEADTLAGLSGFGDLALTCTSDTSRNYRFGLSLGRNETFDASVTVEGAATAKAAADLAIEIGVDMPITNAVAALASGSISVQDALKSLLSRPLKEE